MKYILPLILVLLLTACTTTSTDVCENLSYNDCVEKDICGPLWGSSCPVCEDVVYVGCASFEQKYENSKLFCQTSEDCITREGCCGPEVMNKHYNFEKDNCALVDCMPIQRENTDVECLYGKCRFIPEVNNFEDCVAAGNPIMESYPEKCMHNGETFVKDIKEYCPDERPEFCTKEYMPVCGYVQVECITEPCDPVPQTFGNGCTACSNERVQYYEPGECT